jgi:hypothetical protein
LRLQNISCGEQNSPKGRKKKYNKEREEIEWEMEMWKLLPEGFVCCCCKEFCHKKKKNLPPIKLTMNEAKCQ